ncbi:MAG TPA: hypothetical protein VGJ09_10735 [Bryobacteraceae bacterium]
MSARAGLITYLQGAAYLDGTRVFLKTTRFPQMRDGQALSTGRGRAELLLAPGVILRLADDSRVRMENTQLSNTRVTIERGDVLIEVLQLPEGSQLQVRLGDSVTEFTRPGLYRFGTMQKTLKVYGGDALVRLGPAITLPVKRGLAVDLNPGLAVSRFDRKQTDLLHNWAARRSFDLFMGDPEAREKQNHWQAAGSGYLENKNFGVAFHAFLRRGPVPPSLGPGIPRAETR